MIQRIIRKIYHPLIASANSFIYSIKNKIFCIGLNKTGTSSITDIFRQLNIPVAPQRKGELLIKEVANNNFDNFINYVKYEGVAFQDVPCSLPNTFKILDKKFSNSKFILTIRDSPEAWYKSLTKAHAIRFGNGKIPNKSDLVKARYIYPGWMWELNRISFNTPEDDIYNEDILIKHYVDHYNSVIKYFEAQPEKLLVVNLKETDAAKKICHFLNSKKVIEKVPWKNKSLPRPR